MLDRPEKGERAVLVHLQLRQHRLNLLESDRQEFIELVRSAGAEIADVFSVQRDVPDAKYFIGTGKVEELAAHVAELEATVVLFNTTLSPSQERNLEQALKCRVVDRTGLILDIFAQRARTFEGKLQVELAQLEHHATRLVRGWTHLERQKGGIGLRGPGETQLETDRRLIRNRIKHLKIRLERVRQQRQQNRQARQKADMLTISLVGYTNSGKSTLFNTLTHSEVWAANQLFATLDPTLRSIEVPQLGRMILADTVGFIQHLPHSLVDAFRATLEETENADLLLHVIDVSHDDWRMQGQEVEKVLEQINALNVPRLEVYNKIDLLPGGQPHEVRDNASVIQQVWLSARHGLGIELLRSAIVERLAQEVVRGTVLLRADQDTAKMRAALFEEQAVMSHTILENGDELFNIAVRQLRWHQLCRKLGTLAACFERNRTEEADTTTDTIKGTAGDSPESSGE